MTAPNLVKSNTPLHLDFTNTCLGPRTRGTFYGSGKKCHMSLLALLVNLTTRQKSRPIMLVQLPTLTVFHQPFYLKLSSSKLIKVPVYSLTFIPRTLTQYTAVIMKTLAPSTTTFIILSQHPQSHHQSITFAITLQTASEV